MYLIYIDMSVHFQNYKIYVNGFIERLLQIKCAIFIQILRFHLHDISFALNNFFLTHGRFNNQFS